MSDDERKIKKLVNISTKIGSGITPRGGDKVYTKTGVHLIRSQNIYDFVFDFNGLVCIDDMQADKMKNVEVQSEDILLNITGDSVARCCQVPEKVLPARVNQHVSIVRPKKEEILPKYLLYYLVSYESKEKMLSLAYTGGTRKALTKSMIENLNIKVPSLVEQKAIATTLSCLDDKIELNNRINKILEEMARAIFKSYFVDFELFQNGEFEDSELGRIPKGWRVGKLSDIANIVMGQSPNGSSYNQAKIGEVFYQGRTDFGERYPTIRIYTTEPKRVARKGDILLSVRAPVGDINVSNSDCCIGRGLAALKSKSGSNSYLMYQLLNLKNKFNVYNGEGTVFGSINKEDLHNMKIIIPTEFLISQFQSSVEKLDDMFQNNSIQNKMFMTIRDTLLPKLMSGKIRIPLDNDQAKQG